MANPLTIELSRSPKVVLLCDGDWTCQHCKEHTALMVENQWNCVFCMIHRSGKDNIIMFDWRLAKAASGQINASRIR